MSVEFCGSNSFVELREYFNQKLLNAHLRDLIIDNARNTELMKEQLGICLDFSRQRLDKNALQLLLKLAEERKVREKIEQMFKGDKINTTEGRSVLHVALRMPIGSSLVVNGKDVAKDAQEVLQQIKNFSEQIRNGTLKGATGKMLLNLICIGIGGSYLGGEFLVEALATDKAASKQANGRTIRFLANVDPIDVARATRGLNPEETLVCIISKTFTTAEAILNAKTLKVWLMDSLKSEEAVGLHMCAVSTAMKLTGEFGISPDRVFGFWDFVGGRYSVTSAVGALPLSIHYGFDTVRSLLDGCHAMDEHFRYAPAAENLPLLMGLLSVYNANILGNGCVAVLPYCQALHRFAAHIQQLAMESNGKGVGINGQPLAESAGQIFFGEPGTNGQHSFYQLMHQGRIVPAEFIGFCKSQNPIYVEGEAVSNHDELMSNFFAQPDALAFGKTEQQLLAEGVSLALVKHKAFSGNRPSTVLLFPECTAYTLGLLLSLYENRVATEGFLWGINSFDQWGVELGKILAKSIRKIMMDTKGGKK